MDYLGQMTSRGETLRKQALAGAGKLVFTRAAAGSGTTGQTALALEAEKQSLPLDEPRYTESGIVLPVDLVAALAEEDYLLTEVGLYVQDGAGETLYCVYRASEALAISKTSAMSIRFELEEVSGAAPQLEVPVSGYITVQDLTDYAKLSALDEYAKTAVLADYAKTSALSKYATVASLGDYAKTSALSSYVTTTALNNLKGAANGLATLDGSKLIPVGQMPYTLGTAELEAGVSALANGKLHFVYE